MMLLTGICVYVIAQFLLLIYAVRYQWQEHRRAEMQVVKLSILIPCRNEELDLPKLLASLERLDYPADAYDIWLADDQSTDSTAAILQAWSDAGANRHFVKISEDQERLYHVNGKANALAILAKKAEGELFFFTDADCQVPTSWLWEGQRSIPEDTAMLLGVTQVQDAGIFGQMQEVDWWHTLGIVKVMNDQKLGLTGLGNNMIVRKSALLESGGFESLPDSLTEDLALCRQLLKHGYLVSQQVSPELLAKTKAEPSFGAFLKQRKRWISGVVSLPWYWQLILALELSFYPAVITLLFFYPVFSLGLWGLKILVQGLFIRVFAAKAGQSVGWSKLVFFDFYQIITASISILYYFWPDKISWKSRKYT